MPPSRPMRKPSGRPVTLHRQRRVRRPARATDPPPPQITPAASSGSNWCTGRARQDRKVARPSSLAIGGHQRQQPIAEPCHHSSLSFRLQDHDRRFHLGDQIATGPAAIPPPPLKGSRIAAFKRRQSLQRGRSGAVKVPGFRPIADGHPGFTLLVLMGGLTSRSPTRPPDTGRTRHRQAEQKPVSAKGWLPCQSDHLAPSSPAQPFQRHRQHLAAENVADQAVRRGAAPLRSATGLIHQVPGLAHRRVPARPDRPRGFQYSFPAGMCDLIGLIAASPTKIARCLARTGAADPKSGSAHPTAGHWRRQNLRKGSVEVVAAQIA